LRARDVIHLHIGLLLMLTRRQKARRWSERLHASFTEVLLMIEGKTGRF
jgi:hypothetical protein